ncbi:unnamed protein product (macronuclear) [Paramecium tetraurelia]|uniref:Uncharacterized protein n=1 Tax=Paramecium tetraurelia TaxID=5888 RepID=A0C5R7_PARTE|nr:uncharacterized protein GSPATT00035263001 [Paramecium tetraurelia]CAK66134.1 unnamed protein product [Paramecium tetraurelia]|eukprot:XP_001433531.1 hypothetical protein (macronuclear) [Paramecium tetraurelia strain d4-2]
MKNDEQFLSFMVENDDSQLVESRLFKENDDDYFKSLSKQFYGSKSQDGIQFSLSSFIVKKQLKIIKSAGDLKMKLSNTVNLNNVLKPFSISYQLQQQIHKLLSKPKPQGTSLSSSFKTNQKINQMKLTYQQLQNRKLVIPKNEDSNIQTQNSYRSTLNTSTKSQPKKDNVLDLYQMKLKTERSVEKPKLIKVLKRNKIH